MDPGDDFGREFRPADERRSDLPPPMPAPLQQWQPRPVVAPRLTVAPPPPPPSPAGRPRMGQIASGYPTATTLFVGDLHWWTTDAEIEAELCKYGQVKEVKYFHDWRSGKSKGFCQADFYDPIAAAACEEGMNGHIFDGRPCVVALVSPHLFPTMGARHMNENRQTTGAPQNGRGGGGRMGNRRPVHVPPPPVLHPGAMLCPGFNFNPMDYGAAAMGGMAAGFRGSPAWAPGGAPFPGMMLPFPPTAAPLFDPAFFGRWPAHAGGGRGGQEQSSYGETSHRKSRMAERDRYGGSGQNSPERKHGDERERVSGRQQEMNWERDRNRDRDRDRDREKEQKRHRSRSREVEHSKRRRRSSRSSSRPSLD
ncbi:cleavage and polyadenylation specificity factor subunit 6-like [Zingiber officinale]|uniref:RRM domain-containing protein n=1 Tax=Zingiber officinale TaxID=94328 RepID=A0A8J5G2Z1_ZINOF|nr:cleavage and polyadenylation specificity factor subunit 6-like [Zingiber officinale]KAG6498861.1 hypothetical protein ZIOFF_038611 [Zingiber officinale]